MGIFSGFFGLFSSDASSIESASHSICDDTINPATGLPMAGCIDVEGNPYGADLDLDTTSSTSMFDDDTFNSAFDSSFDDSSMFSDSFSSFNDDW